MTNALAIRQALSCGRDRCVCMSGRGSLTHCPVHRDAEPSLSVVDGHSAPLVTCHTGCAREDVLAALRDKGLIARPKRQESRPKYEPVATYRYLDETGTLVGEKGRFQFTRDGEMRKTFLWRLPGSPRWEGLGGRVMPLFNLMDALTRLDEPVWFVEGEKAAQSLTVRGLVAVCGYAGASQKTWDHTIDYLLGRQIILWPDNDDPGYALMGTLLRRFPKARLIQPELPEKADAHDYFEAGGTVEALAELAGVEVRRIALPDNVVSIRAPGVRRPFAS